MWVGEGWGRRAAGGAGRVQGDTDLRGSGTLVVPRAKGWLSPQPGRVGVRRGGICHCPQTTLGQSHQEWQEGNQAGEEGRHLWGRWRAGAW